jgi:hypothetical protein
MGKKPSTLPSKIDFAPNVNNTESENPDLI